MVHPCPKCRKKVLEDAPSRPFCSERCRLLDLGAWLEGSYRIPVSEPDQGAESDPSEEPLQ